MRTSLGTLFDGSNSAALGINDAGQIVGSANDAAGGTSFIYSNGIMQDLHVGGIKGINDSGVMVGTLNAGTGTASDFGVTYDGSINSLPLLPGSTGYSIASAINNHGQVTGTASSGLGNFAFVAQGGSITSLGAFGASAESHGIAINDSAHVTGIAADASGTDHAFLYFGGPLIDLGTLPGSTRSRGLGINDSDTVVGYADSQIDNTYGNRAFVSFGGQMVDLNSFLPADSGWSQLWQATGINDSGDIVGWGLSTTGTFDAFLATPTSAVPEANSMLPMLIMCMAFAGILRGRHH